MNTNDLVSVILTTKDRPSLLKRALIYINAQSHTNIEVIIVDDCSKQPFNIDHSQYKHLRQIRLFRNSCSIGANKSRAIGLKHAKGKFVCFHDDDDYWFHDKVFYQLSFLIANTQYIGVTCSAVSQKKIINPKPYIDKLSLSISNTVGSFSQIMLRNTAELHANLNLSLHNAQDWWFWLSIYDLNGKIGVIPQTFPQLFFNEGNHQRISSRANKETYYASYMRVAERFCRNNRIIFIYHACIARYHTSQVFTTRLLTATYILVFRMTARLLSIS